MSGTGAAPTPLLLIASSCSRVSAGFEPLALSVPSQSAGSVEPSAANASSKLAISAARQSGTAAAPSQASAV